jgi:RNA polymerase sigma factor (sigma-70 family)
MIQSGGGVPVTLLEGRLADPPTESIREVLGSLYEGVAQGCARRFKVEPDDMRDSLHDVLVGLLEREGRQTPECGVDSWPGYLATATLRAYQRAKREARRVIPVCDLNEKDRSKLFEERSSPIPEPWEIVSDQEILDRARDLIELLPLRQRSVLVLYLEGRSFGEIALSLGITPGNARFHKHAAIRSLRARLDPA